MADTLAGALIEAQAQLTRLERDVTLNEELLVNDLTRQIIVPNSELIFGVTSDEKAERKHFRCSRYVGDNIDLLSMGLQINYQNAKGEKDIYVVSDVQEEDGTGDITFSWLLSRKVTQYKGQVTFILCVTNVEDNKVKTEWNTTLAKGQVIEGLEVSDVLIEQPEIDVLKQLIQLTEESSREAKQAVKTANESLAEVQETGTEVSALKETLEGIIEQAEGLLERLEGLDKKAEITYEIVSELPEQGENGVIYLVPLVTRGIENLYTEYLWIESISDYEPIGQLPKAELQVDGELSKTSENPVQNKTVTKKFGDIEENYWALSGGTQIPINADLNDYTTYGNYYIPTTSGSRTLLNTPIEASSMVDFTMKVFSPLGTTNGGYIAQLIMLYGNHHRYYRYYSGDAHEWKPWNDLDEANNIINNQIMHRNIYRGKNLGTSFTATQKAVIANGSFNDLYVGDYWVINGVTWRIVDINYWLNNGDTNCTTNHLVVMPDTILYSAQMNETNITTGGYVGSKMYTENLENAKTLVYAAFGETAVLNHREYLTNAVSNGYPSAGAWYDSKVELPNEIMMYGSLVFTPAGDGSFVPNRYTIDKTQLALMAAHPRFINPARQTQWLRDVVSGTFFARVNGLGVTDYYDASSSSGVRPVFGLKG